MLYVVFAGDEHDVYCVARDTTDTKQAVKEVKEAWGGWLDCMCFDKPPLDAILTDIEDIRA